MRSFKPLVASFMLLLAVSCGGPPPPTPPGEVMPGESSHFLHLARFALTARGCSARNLTWAVSEGDVGGTVTSIGVYVAPPCNPQLVPGTYHVVATDSDCGKSVSFPIVVKDTVSQVEIVCAVVQGTTDCTPDPTNVSVEPGQTVQFYAKVTFVCGESAYSPPLPKPPPAGVR